MDRTLVVLVGSLLALGSALFLIARNDSTTTDSDGGRPIVLACACSNRAVMEKICAEYEE